MNAAKICALFTAQLDEVDISPIKTAQPTTYDRNLRIFSGATICVKNCCPPAWGQMPAYSARDIMSSVCPMPTMMLEETLSYDRRRGS